MQYTRCSDFHPYREYFAALLSLFRIEFAPSFLRNKPKKKKKNKLTKMRNDDQAYFLVIVTARVSLVATVMVLSCNWRSWIQTVETTSLLA